MVVGVAGAVQGVCWRCQWPSGVGFLVELLGLGSVGVVPGCDQGEFVFVRVAVVVVHRSGK